MFIEHGENKVGTRREELLRAFGSSIHRVRQPLAALTGGSPSKDASDDRFREEVT